MENYSYSVKTKIRTDKKREDETCPIYIQVIINRKIKKLTIKGEFVNINNWNKSIGRAKGKGYKPLNDMLDKKEQDVKDYIRKKNTNNEMPTFEELANFWNGKKSQKNDFFDFYDKFCETKFTKITKSTSVHYVTLRKKLFNFKPDLKFTDINLSLMEDFVIYLNKTESGRYNMVKFFKTVLNRADLDGLLDDRTWKKIENKIEKKEPISLSKRELTALKTLDLKDFPILLEVRDMFLFSSYTGARHSDVIRFKKQHIKGAILKYKQRKTGNLTKTPLLPEALNLLKKYIIRCKSEDETLFTPFTNTYTNRKLKEVIAKSRLKRTFSYHTSRHTCASLLYQQGIDIVTIGKMIGHKKPLQTLSYLHASPKVIKEKVQNVRFTS